jgi:photosystem II stability/assembly factor-like uncharacterized protein
LVSPINFFYFNFPSQSFYMSRISILISAVIFCLSAYAQVDTKYLSSLKWRCIGPYRGGRTVGAVGVPQQPNVFYIGVNNGGVWKTTDYGRTWLPIFDEQPTGSIGDVAVAPSDPNVVYVGSGEGLQRPDLSVGDGIYKSTDAGKTWQQLTNSSDPIGQELSRSQQIGGLAIDPKNENRVFVAALGHPYGPNKERGVYRSINGGSSWEKVLYIDENTGAIQVTIDPSNANNVFADMWAGRQGPWENGAWNGANSGLYKSTDGGTTWKKITRGLPTPAQGLGRIGFCIAPSDGNRLYATVDSDAEGGIYRSDDAGESWYRIQTDSRLWSRGSDFAEVKVDPKNPDIVFSANVVTWKSADGGKNWKAFRGAPGGDDYHRIWINPDNPEIILITSDQGAIITVNGGESFSSWYNQPTAQFYHVSTDNQFPYNVYGGQQESGSVGISSRGNDGQINIRDWHPVGVEEYGYVAVDPLNPDIIYGGKISKTDRRTGQVQDISPEAVRSGKYRFLRTAPVLFSPADPKVLYFAGNVVFKTTNGGSNWEVISPDLTREQWEIPASVGIYKTDNLKTMKRRGVIYTLAPSSLNKNLIWCGTDDGLIHVTKDGGKTWKDITPAGVDSWSKIALIDASHFDEGIAYAAVNRIRCDDLRPHIYKTTDGGTSWKEIVNGLPNDPINAVREDPFRKGLLYAGSERAVYVSFDAGAHWQSLRLNMPATSIRDLVIKDDDIVVGTHGRGFWILDNISPLRQLDEATLKATTVLHKPAIAFRVRWNQYTDTPIPQEEPAGENPPDGAMIDYYLSADSKDEVQLQILDSKGKVVRAYSTQDTVYTIPDVNIPHYWIRPQQLLSGKTGIHRFLWDMKYAPLNIPAEYPIAAAYKNTAPVQTAPWVMPGSYTVRLLVGGKSHEQPLEVKMDPRVTTAYPDLQQQHEISVSCYEKRRHILEIRSYLKLVHARVDQQPVEKLKKIGESLRQLKEKLALLEAPEANGKPAIEYLEDGLTKVFDVLQGTDMKPTSQLMQSAGKMNSLYDSILSNWEIMKTTIIPVINKKFKKSGIQPLPL